MWAVKKICQQFYGTLFIVVSDHQSHKDLESLATDVKGVQRSIMLLSAYNYTLV